MDKLILKPGVTVHFRPDGILHIHYDDIYLKVDDTRYVFQEIRKHCPWEISPVYLTGGGFTDQDSESRKFNGSPEVTKHCSAIAMLSTSLSQKILANFFMRIIRPANPTKSFINEAEAIEWLKQYPTIHKKSD